FPLLPRTLFEFQCAWRSMDERHTLGGLPHFVSTGIRELRVGDSLDFYTHPVLYIAKKAPIVRVLLRNGVIQGTDVFSAVCLNSHFECDRRRDSTAEPYGDHAPVSLWLRAARASRMQSQQFSSPTL